MQKVLSLLNNSILSMLFVTNKKGGIVMGGSEIARLRQRLEEEYIAGRRALYELASGWAQHRFISARMENMERCHKRLAELVGEEKATEIACEVFSEATAVSMTKSEGQSEQTMPESMVSQKPGNSEPVIRKTL
jgi:hypothetical protein